VPAGLEWGRIEALLVAVGAQLVEVRFALNGVVVTFHRPHPHKEAKPYQVRDACRFLIRAGAER